MDLLGRTLLAIPTAVTSPRARELWRLSLGLADGAYVLLVIIAGVIPLAHESLQVQYTIKDGTPAAGRPGRREPELLVRRSGVELANAASAALLGQGVSPAQVAATIKTLALAPLRPGSVFVPLLLAGTCVVRAMLVVFLVVAAPIMLAERAVGRSGDPGCADPDGRFKLHLLRVLVGLGSVASLDALGRWLFWSHAAAR